MPGAVRAAATVPSVDTSIPASTEPCVPPAVPSGAVAEFKGDSAALVLTVGKVTWRAKLPKLSHCDLAHVVVIPSDPTLNSPDVDPDTLEVALFAHLHTVRQRARRFLCAEIVWVVLLNFMYGCFLLPSTLQCRISCVISSSVYSIAFRYLCLLDYYGFCRARRRTALRVTVVRSPVWCCRVDCRCGTITRGTDTLARSRQTPLLTFTLLSSG